MTSSFEIKHTARQHVVWLQIQAAAKIKAGGGICPSHTQSILIPPFRGKHLLQRIERSSTNICMTAKADRDKYSRSRNMLFNARGEGGGGNIGTSAHPAAARERTVD